MNTLDLKQAAAYLHMSPSALGQLARTGRIKAAKPGKCWVFLERDLVAYLDGLYAIHGQAPQRDCEEETSQWESRNAAQRGGLTSLPRTEKEYAALLGLKKRR